MEAVPVSYRIGEHHAFRAADAEFLYLVPSGAIFQVEGLSKSLVALLAQGERNREELIRESQSQGHSQREIESTLKEMEHAGALALSGSKPETPTVPIVTFPLQRVVLNLTNQCNLACTYCYEYSEDKISDTVGKPKYMTPDVAESALDMLIDESSGRSAIHVTFFGGETLLNFPVMRS